MNEINNNIHIVSISSNLNKSSEVKSQKVVSNEPTRELSADTGILGKSQVSKPDNIQSDIDFCLKQSPEFLQKCDTFFESALDKFTKSGEDFAYEKACVLAKEFANEFA